MSVATYSFPRTKPRVFTTGHIVVGSVIAGPVGAFTMLGLNYRALGYAGRLTPTVIAGLVLAALYFTVSMNFVQPIHTAAVTACYQTVTLTLAGCLQRETIASALKSGLLRQDWATVAITVAVSFIVALALNTGLFALIKH